MLHSIRVNDLRWQRLLQKICEIKMENENNVLENPDLALPVGGETPLKEMVVNYIGQKVESRGRRCYRGHGRRGFLQQNFLNF